MATLDNAVGDFNKSIPGIQNSIAGEVDLLIKGLDIKNGVVQSSVANLKRIAGFKDKIMTIIKRSDYQDKLGDFMNAFDEVAVLNNQYFASIADDFKPGRLLEEIKQQNIDSTLESLTDAGMNANFIKPMHDILLRNATSGGTYQQLINQTRDYITNIQTGSGALERYVKTATTDSLNTFAGQYMDAISNDLGLDWGKYVGPIINTSRAFCIACIAKEFIHKSELEDVIHGDFPEFEDADGKIDSRTGLPSGMKPGTNPQNFSSVRGGWRCDHQYIPVSETSVPIATRMAVYEAKGIAFDEKGFKLKI